MDSNSDFSVIQSVASRYTNYDILVPYVCNIIGVVPKLYEENTEIYFIISSQTTMRRESTITTKGCLFSTGHT
jgi:hypothetical protein